jgi:DNA-binding MarR family transcriptional regulator
MPRGDRLTRIILSIFRVNGHLMAAGDDLVDSLDLTSAKWKVLGAVAMASEPITAPRIAHVMGMTRQGVQKQIDALLERKFVLAEWNPIHKRSPLYRLTPKGKTLYRESIRRQKVWVSRLAESISEPDLMTTERTLGALIDNLQPTREGL